MLLYNLGVGTPLFAPPVIPVAQSRDYIGDVIVAAITGENVRAAAQRASDLMKRAIAEAQ
jgi:hypothetical protein